MNKIQKLHLDIISGESFLIYDEDTEQGDSRRVVGKEDFDLVANKCSIITKQIATQFADWIVEQKWDKVMEQGYKDDGTLICKSTEELFQEFVEKK